VVPAAIFVHVAAGSPQALVCHWKVIPDEADAPVRLSVNAVLPATKVVELLAVPADGVPVQGALSVVAVWNALAAPVQVAVFALTVYQYCVSGLSPLMVADVAPVAVTVAVPTGIVSPELEYTLTV